VPDGSAIQTVPSFRQGAAGSVGISGAIDQSLPSFAQRAEFFATLEAIRADALRLYYAGQEINHLRAVGTVPGVRVLHVAARNGHGAGILRYLGGNLYWRAPGSSTFGAAVAVPTDGHYLLFDGDDLDAFVRVEVYTDHLLAGDARVFLRDRYENAIGFDDVTAAEAAAGDVTTWSITCRNESDEILYDLTAWVDFATTGITLSADDVTYAAGVALGNLDPAESVPLYIKRTIAAAADYAPRLLTHLHFRFQA